MFCVIAMHFHSWATDLEAFYFSWDMIMEGTGKIIMPSNWVQVASVLNFQHEATAFVMSLCEEI